MTNSSNAIGNADAAAAVVAVGSSDNFSLKSGNKYTANEEMMFANIIPQSALSFLRGFEKKAVFDTAQSGENSNQLKNARESIYFWRNNPENNEKNMRQELNVPTKNTEEDNRNILGIQTAQDWIEHFNIGTIMHMTSVSYEELVAFDDILFELTKKQLVEKVNRSEAKRNKTNQQFLYFLPSLLACLTASLLASETIPLYLLLHDRDRNPLHRARCSEEH